jgi:hypothetical protein
MIVLAISGTVFGIAQAIFAVNYVMSLRINARSQVTLRKEAGVNV